jgi:chemotaxis protein MotB
MAFARRSTQRVATSIWPGFVDAMTALILVLFFVLSIFMIVQFVLRDTISGQDRELDTLSREIAGLADALGLARAEASRQENLIATLTADLGDADARIADFEQQVAALIARNTDLTGSLAAAEEDLAETTADLTAAQETIAAGEASARLAEARREALEALTATLRQEAAAAAAALDETQASLDATQLELDETRTTLDDTEAARLAEAAAAELLRERLQNSEAELTALTLSLEAERRRAEETLTLLAAANAARESLQSSESAALSEAERQAALVAQANALLGEQEAISAEAQRQVALLNQQTAQLRTQLASLQGLLDEAQARDAEAQIQIETLGANLNTALARVAAEERARAELEARERERLEAEALDLERYRSEFFGRMREILGEREGVQVVGDRFVFPSEVLFEPGSATLGPEGRAQVARVAAVIREIAGDIPPEIDWILRVDGHTDRIPISPGAFFADNWELSQARALSVVRYMIEAEGLPPGRLAATGFGEFQPVDPGDSPEALARNRRIELKFTER